MAVLLWARLAFLIVLALLVSGYAWTAFRTREKE
jgi:cbb3-type cytochrome oxidase subunit 3